MPEDFEGLRVVDLKEECKKRNLLVGGKKQDLIDRLLEYEASKEATNQEEPQDTTEASEKDTSVRSGAPDEGEAAAEDILHADTTPSTNSAAQITDSTSQDEAEPAADAKPTTLESPKASSRRRQPAVVAPPRDEEAAEEGIGVTADNADSAALGTAAASSPAASTKKKLQSKSGKEPAETQPSITEEPAGATADTPTTSVPVLETEIPAVEASTPLASTAADAPLVPATEVVKVAPEAASAQPKSLGSAQDDSASTAMDVQSALDASIPIAAETNMADVSEQEPEAAPTEEADKAADHAAPSTTAATDTNMVDATAVGDAEIMRYDEPSGDQAAPAKQQAKHQSKPSEAKHTEGSRSHRHGNVSTSKAANDESATHGSARKRGREANESAQKDRKAPRTDRKGDVKASHREHEREKEKDKGKDREEKTQVNGNAPSERRRKHAPISYKPPERKTSEADRDKAGTDTVMREARLERQVSGADKADALPKQGSGLESKQSGLDRSVSRTDSGHKLSVFERLQRGKGEGSGTPALPPSRDPTPAPASTRPADPLPRTTSHSRRNQPTRALKVEGFVRPFTEPAARAMLSETGEIVSMWMPKIKTHAFVIYTTQGQAEATLKATHGLNWPPGNPSSKLQSKFVSVEEAETAIARAGGGMPPGSTALPAAAHPVANGLPLSRGPSTTQDARPGPDASDRAQRGRADLDEPRRSRDGFDDRRRPREEDRGRVKEDAMLSAPEAIPEPMVQEAPPPTLDDLFRKTSTKPCLYWLPLTEEQAIERKAKLEAAAAEKSKAEDLPDAPVPMAVA